MTTAASHPSSGQNLAQVLGSRIRELREARGLSQRQLADQLRLSKSIVAKYEAGVHLPSVLVLVRVADLFAVGLDGLVARRQPADVRLRSCVEAIEAMDMASQILVLDAIEGIVNAYRLLFAGRRVSEPTS